jgi:SAM-dependent methyltransferase
LNNVLQLGCGIRPLEGAINHDLEKHSDFVDVTWDLNEMPWCWQDEEFDKIIALDVMEHLKTDVDVWLDECWRILKPGGLLVMRLPAWDHENSHIDPTHRRLFHEHTFDYWDKRTECHNNYGSYYYRKSNKWWITETVERRDAGANLFYVLRKDAE